MPTTSYGKFTAFVGLSRHRKRNIPMDCICPLSERRPSYDCTMFFDIASGVADVLKKREDEVEY